jgi:cytochrome c-type biogenesis protein CcmH/NrfF
MEIWIIGGLFVLLMFVVSTKIKKAAAAAYEREEVVRPTYSIVKPQGIIIPAAEISDTGFEGVSKDFGDSETTESLRKLTVSLKQLESPNTDVPHSQSTAVPSMSEEVIDHVNTKIVTMTLSVVSGLSWQLRIVVPELHWDEMSPKVSELTGSFRIKQ